MDGAPCRFFMLWFVSSLGWRRAGLLKCICVEIEDGNKGEGELMMVMVRFIGLFIIGASKPFYLKLDFLLDLREERYRRRPPIFPRMIRIVSFGLRVANEEGVLYLFVSLF